jgi:hypothetical protein
MNSKKLKKVKVICFVGINFGILVLTLASILESVSIERSALVGLSSLIWWNFLIWFLFRMKEKETQ